MDGIGIYWMSLNDYLKDSDAPPGIVCFVDGTPQLQVDFLGKAYTVFWLGSIDADSFLFDFFEVFNETLLWKTRRNLGPFLFHFRPPTFKASVSVVTSHRVADELSFTREEDNLEYKPKGRSKMDAVLLRNQLHMLQETRNVASIQIDFETARGSRRVSLWGDTHKSPKKEREVGLTIDVTLPYSPALRTFLQKTSHRFRRLQESALDDLFETIRINTFEKGYGR